jgi:nicotinate-nucleotide adenylyltransferase
MTLGILGGTFDPIHNGHVAAAAAAQAALGLDAITLIPSHIPPHRRDPVGATAEQRYAMAALAAAERSGWSASRIEIDREGPSYTYDTLVKLREVVSVDAEYFFILGADAFAEIATWSRYPAVLDLAHFLVVSRPGITLDSLRERVPSAFSRRASADTRVTLIEANTPDISATGIRARIRSGGSIDGLVPSSVASYITAHRLYVSH